MEPSKQQFQSVILPVCPHGHLTTIPALCFGISHLFSPWCGGWPLSDLKIGTIPPYIYVQYIICLQFNSARASIFRQGLRSHLFSWWVISNRVLVSIPEFPRFISPCLSPFLCSDPGALLQFHFQDVNILTGTLWPPCLWNLTCDNTSNANSNNNNNSNSNNSHLAAILAGYTG